MQSGHSIKQNNSLNFLLFGNLYKLWEYRQLLFFLTLRDIKVRYKQAFFGITWAILTPTVQAVIFALVFGAFLKISTEPFRYFLVVFSGFIFWNFFSQSVSTATVSLIGNYNLVTKTVFPKDILILSSVMGRIPDLMASFFVLFFIFALYHITPSPLILWLIPLILLEVILAVSIGLFFSSINVYYRDITALTPLFLTVWLYLSPVIYSLEAVPDSYKNYLYLNPMTGILEGVKNVLIVQKPPNFLGLTISATTVLLLFFFSHFLFKKLEKGFADII